MMYKTLSIKKIINSNILQVLHKMRRFMKRILPRGIDFFFSACEGVKRDYKGTIAVVGDGITGARFWLEEVPWKINQSI